MNISINMNKPGPPVMFKDESNITDFGGWESKLRRNLKWTPEQILTWLDEINKFNNEIRVNETKDRQTSRYSRYKKT
ncbi:MAG: hypothetical protein ACUZ8H_04460 [Candidatus Anammoxibacter sp.]